MTDIQFTAIARLLKRRDDIWQFELPDGDGMAEFDSAGDAIRWLLKQLDTDELRIIVPDNFTGDL